MKVTVMSKEVALAAGLKFETSRPWIVSAPDGIWSFHHFLSAKAFAKKYNMPVSFL